MYEPFTPDDMRARAVQARRAVVVLLLWFGLQIVLLVIASARRPCSGGSGRELPSSVY